MSTRLYERLGVSQAASEEEIKKAYRKAALKHHPDRGGNEETFKDISFAYDTLSNPEKRQLYDRCGEDAVRGNGHEMNPNDIFARFFGGHDPFEAFASFGGMGGSPFSLFGSSGPRGAKDVHHKIKLSLEEVYHGCTKKLRITRKELQDKTRRTCSECGGQGRIQRTMRSGFSVQTIISGCPVCSGSGVSQGAYKEVKEVIEIRIPAGAPMHHQIRIQGKADEDIHGRTGDLIVVCDMQEHHEYERHDTHLVRHCRISLLQCLLDSTFSFLHLDGQEHHVCLSTLHAFDSVYKVPGMGLPDLHQASAGDLYLRFEPFLEKPLDAAQKREIAKKVRHTCNANKDAERMHPVHIQGGPKKERVQCAQQ